MKECTCIYTKWNLTNQDLEEHVLIPGVVIYTSGVFGTYPVTTATSIMGVLNSYEGIESHLF